MRAVQKVAMAPTVRIAGYVSVAGACALLWACVTLERIDAAHDVRSLLTAIRDDDRAAFDAHIDRPALERQLEGRILARAEASGAPAIVRGLGAALAAPLASLAVETLVQPRVFRTIAEYYGYGPDTHIPAQITIAEALRALPDGRVCAARRRDGPCVLTFADEGGVWRLVGFDGDLDLLRTG